MSDTPRLFGSRVLVTGAANGIGEAIVRTFIKEGARVFAVDSNESGVDRIYRAMKGVTPQAASITDARSADLAVAAAGKALGGLDVVVNNAEIQPSTQIADDDESALDAFLDRRIRLYALVSRAAIPVLGRSPAGRVICLGCVRSAFALNGEKASERAETAVAELTRSLAADVGVDGITVNYVQPGAIMTAASRRVFSDNKEFRDYCIKRSAARRLGEPLDVAKVALFLASDDAVFVSGTGITVDGGAV